MKTVQILPALLLGLCSAAMADTSVYRDKPNSYVATNVMLTSVDGGEIDQGQGGFSVRLGGMLDENFGAELRFGRGLWHETQRLPNGNRVQMDVDHIAGVYGVARLPFRMPFLQSPVVDRLFVHALAGLADVQLRNEQSFCFNGCSGTMVKHSSALNFSWGMGLGMEIKLPKTNLPVVNMPERIGLSLEYMDYSGFNDVDLSGIEAGIMMFF